MSWRIDGPEGNETSKIHDRIAPFVSGKGVDLGCGHWKLKVPKTGSDFCLGVDGGAGYFGGAPDVDVISDVTKLELFADESFDYVYSSHTLEDMPHPIAVLMEWWRILKPGGNLILYLPLTKNVAKEIGLYNWQDFYPNKGEIGANIHHQHDYFPKEITEMVSNIGPVEILVDEVRCGGDEYSFLQVYKKLASKRISGTYPIVVMPQQKRALVVRYGAIGDIVQSTPVFKKLKEEGYHVTFNCTGQAKEILKGNPNVDEFIVQIKDYVRNNGKNLEHYWEEVGKGYDRFVNLTGAAEDSLLIGDKFIYRWMDDIRKAHPELDEASILHNAFEECRRRAGDTNYYDNHLAKAGYEDTGMNGELFFTEQEEIMAMGFRAKHPGKFIILWSLAGSSYHKIYPYFHLVLSELTAKNPDVLVVSVGDSECRLLERMPSSRYLPRAGVWELRTSMVMTKYADLVIGPETGILNAAGCFPTPKITLLSHSKHENLCKYWENDFCLAPEGAFCYPCHTLHYTHAPAPNGCVSCDGSVHGAKSEGMRIHGGRFTGLWSCPYTTVPHADNEEFPLCTAIGISPERLLKRINEVYAIWKSKKNAPVQEAIAAD